MDSPLFTGKQTYGAIQARRNISAPIRVDMAMVIGTIG